MWVVIPLLLVGAWWIYDLQVQWRSLVDYQFGWLVLIMSGYLAWERWPGRPVESKPGPAWISLLLSLLGMPMVVLAELYKNGIAHTPAASFLLSMGCCLFMAALLHQWGGWPMLKHFLFPMLFLFVAVPLPQMIWNPLVLNLQGIITACDVEALNLLGIPAVRQANVIQLPRCLVGVDEACSGIRSLQSSVMAALFLGDLLLKRRPMKILFFVTGIGLAILGNFLRSFYLSLTAHRHGLEALKHSHDTAGWSVLAFTAAGLILVAWLLGRWENRSAAPAKAGTSEGG
jgi:exosortase